MPDSNPSKKSSYYNTDLPLKERLKELWNDGLKAEFFSVVMEELQPRVISVIREPRKYIYDKPNEHGQKKKPTDVPNLTDEECDDCFSEALERFIKRWEGADEPVENPQYYIYQFAKNAAIDFIRERARDKVLKDDYKHEQGYASGCSRKRPALDQSGEDTRKASTVIHIPTRSAVPFIEGTYASKYVEVDESWAAEVLREAINRLPEQLRLVAGHMLTYGHDCKSGEAVEDLEMPAVTYRSYRRRATEKLKILIPKVMDEMGHKFRQLPTEQMFSQKPDTFPSEEEDDTGLFHILAEDDT